MFFYDPWTIALIILCFFVQEVVLMQEHIECRLYTKRVSCWVEGGLTFFSELTLGACSGSLVETRTILVEVLHTI